MDPTDSHDGHTAVAWHTAAGSVKCNGWHWQYSRLHMMQPAVQTGCEGIGHILQNVVHTYLQVSTHALHLDQTNQQYRMQLHPRSKQYKV